MILSYAIVKGGTGKTFLTVNTAAAIAKMNKKVLIVDSDMQCNASIHLGIYEPEKSLYDVLIEDCSTEEAILPYNSNLHIIPAAYELALFNLQRKKLTAEKLIEVLEPLKKNYDYIFIDVNPILTILNVNAYLALDKYVIPCLPGGMALKGCRDIIDTIDSIRSDHLKTVGVIFNQFNPQRKMDQYVSEMLRNEYPVFKNYIRQNVRIEEAAAAGKTIFDYDPKCNGSIDVMSVTKELLKILK